MIKQGGCVYRLGGDTMMDDGSFDRKTAILSVVCVMSLANCGPAWRVNLITE
jgi:hypothetical protein